MTHSFCQVHTHYLLTVPHQTLPAYHPDLLDMTSPTDSICFRSKPASNSWTSWLWPEDLLVSIREDIFGSDVFNTLLRLFSRPEIRAHPATFVPGSQMSLILLDSMFRVTLPRSTVPRLPNPCLGSHSITAAGLKHSRELVLPLFSGSRHIHGV